MSLRIANLNDLPTILRMAEEFYGQSPYSAEPFDKEKVLAVIQDMLTGPQESKVVILVLDDVLEEPVGLIAGFAQEALFNRHKIGVELMWWIDYGHRRVGRAFQLLGAFEYWAKKVGCDYVQLSMLHDEELQRMTKLYERRGYQPVERSYLKRVN